MARALFRWVAWILIVASIFSVVGWNAAGEVAAPSGDDLSQYKTLTVGTSGSEVAALKQRMYELGYFKNNTVNESYTAATAEYVKKFEQINGLTVDGIADPEMLVLFFSDKARKSDGTFLDSWKEQDSQSEQQIEQDRQNRLQTERKQRVAQFLAKVDLSQYKKIRWKESSPEVKVLKQRLFDLGYFEVGRNEEPFDAWTDTAVRNFQKINGLSVDGIPGPEMQALLFSELAMGPKPLVNNEGLSAAEIEEQANQRFKDFLMGAGEYSDKSLKGRLFSFYCRVSDLGVSHSAFDYLFYFQCVLLFHDNINGEEVVALGLKDRQGKRIITAVSWPIKSILELGYGVHAMSASKDYSNSSTSFFYDEKEVSWFLDQMTGSLVNFRMDIKPDKSDRNAPNQEVREKYLSFFANKAEVNRKFMNGLWRPKGSDMLSSDPRDFLNKYNGKGSVLKIDNYADFMDLARTATLPFVIDLYY